MMRQQQSGSKKTPSRICKFLLLLVGFKLCLLGMVLAEPFVSFSSLLPSSEQLASFRQGSQPAQPLAVAEAPAQITEPDHPAQAQEPAPKTSHSGKAFAASVNQSGSQSDALNQPSNLTLDALNRKQEELARREQDLRVLEQELDARLIQMQALEQRLQTMLRDAEETKGEKYKHLVDVLSNMKARQAAEVLETLDEKIAVRVLAGMRGRQAGEILTYASPAKAARLTEALARMQMPLE